MDEARKGWFNKLVLGLGLLLLVGQFGFSQALFVYHQVHLARPAGQPLSLAGPTPAAAQSLAWFLAAQDSPGAGVLLVTQDTGSGADQEYYALSEALYPVQVWWAAPALHQSPVDWWIQTSLDPAALETLSRRLGAQLIAFAGLEPPTGLSGEILTRAQGWAVVRVGP